MNNKITKLAAAAVIIFAVMLGINHFGGSIESITLDGREFAIAADAEVNRKVGGFENEIQSNGDGSARIIKTRVPLALDGLTVQIDDARGDHEFLQALADRNDYFPIAITYPSGAVYQGSAMITGEINIENPGVVVKSYPGFWEDLKGVGFEFN